MAIKEYIKDGVRLFSVTVSVYSRGDRSLRKQKFRSGLATLNEAKRVERELVFRAQEDLMKTEMQSAEWGTLVDEWELALRSGTGSSRGLVKTTQEDYINVMRLHTKDWWNRPADQISPADVRDTLVRLHETGRSHACQKRLKTAIDGVFRWGIESRRVKHALFSPARGVALVGRVEEKRPEILTLNEIRLLLKSAKSMGHRWYPIWAMALLTGCRSGELYALQWPDLDFENRRVMISKSFNKRTREIGTTKAGYWREIPMSSELEILLKELKLSRGHKKWVLPHHPEWHAYQQASVLRQFCKELGLPSIRFHALRACFATQLVRDGIAPSIVMKVCGWKDLKTMQRYIRLAGIEIEGATDKLKIMPDE
jgi:integrase